MQPLKQVAFDPESFLREAGLGRTLLKVRNKQPVFSQGEPADAVFYIQRGRVKLTVISKQGKEATIALLGPGDFVGEESIASSHPVRLTSANAMAECFVLRIERALMIKTLHEQSTLSSTFTTFLLSRNARIQEDLVDQLFNSSEKRLARALLLLAQFGKQGKPETIIPKVDQGTLAQMIGTTRSRINFFMNRFRKLGFIDYNGGLQVNSSLLNVILHD